MLNIYADFTEEYLAIPVVRGQKTDKEKFAGAVATYTIEALMHDGQALQCGTSHNFGSDFAKAFDVQFLDKDNKLKPVYETSWGYTTRMIGALIMVHGDDSGLKLPPKIAPVQINIVPIQQKKEGVLDKAYELKSKLIESGFRVKVDDSDKSPGFKFADSEVRGIPLRIEVGPKDIEQGHAVLVRRDTREKIQVSFENLETETAKVLESIQNDMFQAAKKFLEEHTSSATNMDELVEIVNTKRGFVKAMWCGCRECEDKLKEMSGITSRCIPFNQEQISDTCVVCGKPATKMVYWGRAY
jgi:prolyl-tRNA synthetase